VGRVSPVLHLATVGPADTQAMAAALAPLCVAGDMVLLSGDLGAGKTTFSQGFGAALGITEVMTSPTFTLVRQYPVGPGPGLTGPGVEGTGGRIATLLHADVYRLDRLDEIVDLGLGELVEDAAVALVEWGDVAEPVLGEGSLAVELTAGDDDDHRLVSVRPIGEAWSTRWEALSTSLGPWRVEL
jgi:tRNA threonylcarbamoyladenosine biosynthesis protein TsaE